MRLLTICVLLLTAPTLTACQTTRRSVPVDVTTICLALSKADVLPTLDEEEKALLREHFSRDSLDRLKMPRAIMREIGC